MFSKFWQMCRFFSYLRLYRHLNHAVQFILEQVIRLGDVGEFVAVRNQGRGVNLARLDKAQNLRTIAAVHAARFEGQILAVHLGQWQRLRLVVERHNPLVQQLLHSDSVHAQNGLFRAISRTR